MNELPNNHEEYFRLFCSAVNGTLTDSEHDKLQHVLKTDPRARSLWFEFRDVECGLSELRPYVPAAVEPQNHSDGSDATPANLVESRKTSPVRKVALAAVGVLAATLGGAYLVENFGSEPQIAKFGALRDPLWSSPEVAFEKGEPIRVGQVLELFSGSVDVSFESGADVTLFAPCIFQVTSSNSGFLTFGQVKARAATRKSKGFTVQTPTARVVDVGTEFVASAAANGESHVEVTQGEVRVHLPGQKEPQRLLKGDALSVDSGPQPVRIRIENGDGTPSFSLPSIEPPAHSDYGDTARGSASTRGNNGKPTPSGPLASLLDASASASDAANQAVFVGNKEPGKILVDLGRLVPVTKVNTYSWNRAATTPDNLSATQKFDLYGFAGDTLPSTEGSLKDHGWELVGHVDTDDYFGATGPLSRPDQQASSITSASGSLGTFRYLIWVVRTDTPGISLAQHSALYGEFDVYSAQ